MRGAGVQEHFRYWAFVSYSHHDRHWARWLHRRLETYRVPRRLAGRLHAGVAVPRRLMPVFRDRDELPSSADLGGVVQRALAESRYLIVICSRHSATSRWVDEEVETFKRLGREDRILCFKVDEADGGDSCFAPALLRHYDEQGRPTGRSVEPLAADVAETADGREGAALKLIAGMIGVGYDELRRRERRRRIAQHAAAAVAALTLVALAYTGWRWQQREKHAALAAQALHVRIAQLYESGRTELLAHREIRAAVLLGEAYRLGVDTPALRYLLAAAMRVVDAQQRRIQTPQPVVVAELGADGRQALSIGADGGDHRLRVYDAASGALRYEVPLGEMSAYWGGYSFGGGLIWIDSDHREPPLRRLRLYDAASGALRAQFALAADGNRVALPPVDARDRHVAYVEPGGALALARLDGGAGRRIAGRYGAAVFCRDGDALLAGREDGLVELRDADSGALRARFEGLHGTPTMLDAARACTLIAAGAADGSVRVWDRVSGAVRMSGGHSQPIIDLRFSTDGSRLSTLTRGATGVWNGLNGTLLYADRFLSPDGNLAMMRPDGRQLARLADGRLTVLDPRSGLELYALDGHYGATSVFAFDRSNRRLVSGSTDGSLLLWSLPERQLAEIASSPPGERNAPFAFSPDGRRFFAGEAAGGGALWRSDGVRRERGLLGARGPLNAVAFSADGRWLAAGARSGAVDLVDLADGSSRTLVERGAPPVLLDFDAEGRRLGISRADGLFELREPQSDAEPLRFERDQLRAYAFSPTAPLLALGAHGQVRLWDLRRRAWRWTLRLPLAGDEANVGVLRFSPDGRHLLAAARRERAWLLDADDGRVLQQMREPSSAFFGVAAFSPDGEQAVLGDWAKSALLWRPADGRLLTLAGHTAPVRAVSFSPDGALVLSAGDDGIIKLWDAASGALLDSFAAHGGAIRNDEARFSPDGRRILSSGYDGYTRLWPVLREQRDAAAIAARLACRAPWRVEDAALLPRAFDAACSAPAP